jgi:hypothetical protein
LDAGDELFVWVYRCSKFEGMDTRPGMPYSVHVQETFPRRKCIQKDRPKIGIANRLELGILEEKSDLEWNGWRRAGNRVKCLAVCPPDANVSDERQPGWC